MRGVKSEIPLQAHALRLYKGDLDRLASLFPSIGGTMAVRQLVRNFIERIESGLTPLDINLEISADEAKELLND